MARLVGIDLEPLTLCGSHYRGWAGKVIKNASAKGKQ